MCKLLKNHPAVYTRPSTHALPGRTHRPHAAYGLDLPWGIGMLRPQAKHPRRPAVAAAAAKAAGKLAAHAAAKAGTAAAKVAKAARKAAKAAATGAKAAAAAVGKGAKAVAAGAAHAARHGGAHFADADLQGTPAKDTARGAARAVKAGAAKAGSGGAVLSYAAMKKKFGMDATSAPKKPKHAKKVAAKDPTPLRLIHVRTHPEDVAKAYSHVYHTLLFECYEQGGEDAHAVAAGGSNAAGKVAAAAKKAAGAVKHAVKHAASTVAAAGKAGAAKVAAAAKAVHKGAKAVASAATAGHHFLEADVEVDDKAEAAPQKPANAAGKAALKGAAKAVKSATKAAGKALAAAGASRAAAAASGAVPLLFLKLEPRSVDRKHVPEEDRSNVDPAWVDPTERAGGGALGAAAHHAGAAAAATTKHARAALAHAGKAVAGVKAAAKAVHAAVKAGANKTAAGHPTAAAHHRFAQLQLDDALADDAVEGDDAFARRFEEEVAALEASAARFMEADEVEEKPKPAPHAVVQAARKLAAAVAKSKHSRHPVARLPGGSRAAFYALAAFNRTLHRALDGHVTDAALARDHWFVFAAIQRAPRDSHSMLKSAIARDLGLRKMTALPWLLKQERGFRYRLGAEVFVKNTTAARHWDAISHEAALVHHNVTELWTHLPTLVGIKPTCPKL